MCNVDVCVCLMLFIFLSMLRSKRAVRWTNLQKCATQSEISPFFFGDIHDFVGNGVAGMIESTFLFR